MAYVTPDSEAEFFYNTGLNPSNENTLYFNSESEKDSYFYAVPSYSVLRVTYQREHRKFIRVEVPISRLYNVDYMRFKNTSFENKWFYAYVTQVNYINNVTTEIEYQLDPLMTWMGIFKLRQCYVERQHTTSDKIGEWIADEGLSTGEYVDEGLQTSPDYGSGHCKIRVVVANNKETEANMYGGIYNPCMMEDFDSATGAANFIASLNSLDLSDNVVNVYMVPTTFSDTTIAGSSITIEPPYTTISGYRPKNNKLFVYPYKYLYVDNSEGSSNIYRYEFFNLENDSGSKQYTFSISGISANNVSIRLRPVGYKAYDLENLGSRSYNMYMTHFPQCAWSTDSYEAYLAQKNAYFASDFTHSAINALTGAEAAGASANATGHNDFNAEFPHLVTGALNLAGMIATNLYDNSVRPETGTMTRGTQGDDIEFSSGGKRFWFYKKAITPEYAKRIDDYFTMYGYKIGRTQTPNMNARPYYTYVKTIGCNVEGNLPASDSRAIEAIFDNGVRFWHSIDEMGNYELDNSPA